MNCCNKECLLTQTLRLAQSRNNCICHSQPKNTTKKYFNLQLELAAKTEILVVTTRISTVLHGHLSSRQRSRSRVILEEILSMPQDDKEFVSCCGKDSVIIFHWFGRGLSTATSSITYDKDDDKHDSVIPLTAFRLSRCAAEPFECAANV